MGRFFRPMEECLYTFAPTLNTSASLCMRVSTTTNEEHSIPAGTAMGFADGTTRSAQPNKHL
jgi:hypothetical protein